MIKDSERRILRMSKIYFDKNHNLAVPRSYKCFFEGEEYTFGAMLGNVRNFFNNQNDSSKKKPVVYSQELLDSLQKLDPRVFERGYSQKLYREQKEQKLLELFHKFYEKNGNLAVKQTYCVKYPPTGEIVLLGAELVLIRQFVKGKKKNVYSQPFIEKLRTMDARVFDFRYPQNSRAKTPAKESKEK